MSVQDDTGRKRVSDEKVRRRMRDFALAAGWPEVRQYETTVANWRLLARIPGSFAAERVRSDCPIRDPFMRAALDLVPQLLEEGFEGEHLAFGYGRQWHAVGATAEAAMSGLMREHPFQMPKLHGVIDDREIRTPLAHAYRQWKLSNG